MNKPAIKTFATAARKNLKSAIVQKAYDIGIFEDSVAPVSEVQGGFIYNEQSYTKDELAARKQLIETIHRHSDGMGYKHGYSEVIEEVAYTWFNRLIALRFMELNSYLPSGIRILSSDNSDRLEPDCIRAADSLDFVDMRIVGELSDDTEKLYRYILIAQCNALSHIMPRMFEQIADYTELLLPDKLYSREGSIVYDLVHGIAEADFTEQVEIIGWLYQFYISEKKDEVFAGLKKNIKITKENIPAATQLFTPDWIVKYMVENSLGRLAVEKLGINPNDMGWRYYLPEAEQTDDAKAQLAITGADSKDFDIKDVKVIDPCMGSGHILVYAFDVLYQIYEKLGYVARDIPNLILENNLFGLDIDERAGQLAYFALMMKARSMSRRFFRADTVPQPKVYAFPDFEDYKEYGSILKVDTVHTMPEHGQVAFDDELLERAAIIETLLAQKYDVVVTNPPYMGSSGMGSKLAEYVKKHYPDSKSDLFAVFIEQCGCLLKPNGYQAMITQHAFMFLSSYEKLRSKLLHKDIVNMAHLGARAFEEIGGEVVQTTAFVMRNSDIAGYKATFVRLVDYSSQQAKEMAFLDGGNRHTAVKENFEKIPGMPVAYWVSDGIKRSFENDVFSSITKPMAGICTGDNEAHFRLWHEIDKEKIGVLINSRKEVLNQSKFQWFFIYKGGEFRRWYGNLFFVIKYTNSSIKAMEHNKGFRHDNRDYYFEQGITWSKICSGNFSARYMIKGAMFDSTGTSAFPDVYLSNYLLGLLNTKLAVELFTILNPTLAIYPNNIGNLPIIISEQYKPRIDELVTDCIYISLADWDSFETSWDFVRHPLLKFGVSVYSGLGDVVNGEILSTVYIGVEKTYDTFKLYEKNKPKHYTIQSAFDMWERFAAEQFVTLKSNEEELNRIFIDIYGLQDELTPEVEDKDVTIRRADLGRDVRSFISYAVGCMFGRYSLDVDGIAYAGGAWERAKYVSFIPDEDNIIPITDNEYFDDDIVARFIEFVRVVYGEQTLGENLDFIANALYPNGNGSARERIRRYFLNDFYKDHVKVYQKKPIYWQFDSGKQNGFKCLIYLHRYDKYTVARVRTDYLHVLQRSYDAEIKRLYMLSDMTDDTKEKAEYKRQITGIGKQLAECRAYDPAIAHIAHRNIELDLDDGVTVNYNKLMGIDIGADKPMDLLTRI